jgi:protochlorophyllide reductase
MRVLQVTVIAIMLQLSTSFKWMENIKVPSLQEFTSSVSAKSKFGDKKLVVITGTSSGMGKMTARALLRTGEYHVIGACRDLDKMAAVAEAEEFDMSSFTAMELDLASFGSVRSFCNALDSFRSDRPVDRLVCNAAVYQPSLDYPKWTEDGHEQQLQINFLAHFLLVSKLMPGMAKSTNSPRVILVGSVTGNDNTVGGGGVYPIADLKDLEGLAAGAVKPVSMMDGYNFNGAKGYKDSKLALMMLSNMLHDKYHRQTGIAFSSIYPGCIAESPLFREKRPWFRKYFPVFMKYVTGGFVGEAEAGQRLFQVCHDPRCAKSGVYWSWNGGPREGRGAEALEKGGQIMGAGGAGGGWDSIFENDQSDKVLDVEKELKLWKYATAITGAEWPAANQPKSPCPTLTVIGAVTAVLNKKEEIERMTKKAPGNVVGSGIDILAKEPRARQLA